MSIDDPGVARLVTRVAAAEWLELPRNAVAGDVLDAALASGVLQVVVDSRGMAMVRLCPDLGVCNADFDAARVSAMAASVWRQRMRALQVLLATVNAQTPDDHATVDALDTAIRHAAHQCGIFWPGVGGSRGC